ncbi:NAD(P)-dependent dehydrogenase (short-subunit alcohol dehydrogenase family) [Bosea sp. OAE506]
MSDTQSHSGALAGKVAIVTGASQGLGEAIARELTARGLAGLILTGRNSERGEAVAASLKAAGCDARFHAADLADLASVRAIVPAAERGFGRVDILVNAAGDTDRGSVFDTSPELYERVMAVNLRAPFFLIQDAAERMRRQGIAGSIVNIQSMSAHGGQPFLCAYSVSKGALATLTRNVCLWAAAAPDPRQRPQHRLDGDAGRGRGDAPPPWRAGWLAREGRCGPALRPPGRSARGGACGGLSGLG